MKNKSEKQLRWGLRAHAISYVVANLTQIVTWWIFTPEHFFWPLYGLLSWGIGLAFHGWAVRKETCRIRRHQASRA